MKNLLAFVFAMFAISSFASEVTVTGGAMEGTKSASISYTMNSIYKNGNFEVVPEFGLVNYSRPGDSMQQIYATPKLRYWLTKKLSVDGGVGPSFISQKGLGNKYHHRSFGSNFEFYSHISVMYLVTDHVSIGYRLSHVSNAGIKKPNPGIDMQQIMLSYTY